MAKYTYLPNMQTKDNISSMQHRLQYNSGAVTQDNAAQQWWYSTLATMIL